jgi:hypothetical protein
VGIASAAARAPLEFLTEALLDGVSHRAAEDGHDSVSCERT